MEITRRVDCCSCAVDERNYHGPMTTRGWLILQSLSIPGGLCLPTVPTSGPSTPTVPILMFFWGGGCFGRDTTPFPCSPPCLPFPFPISFISKNLGRSRGDHEDYCSVSRNPSVNCACTVRVCLRVKISSYIYRHNYTYTLFCSNMAECARHGSIALCSKFPGISQSQCLSSRAINSPPLVVHWW